MSDKDTVSLFNPHDGLTGRDGGPYLDEEERRLAEIRRAAVEDREPDFSYENIPASAGTPLVTAGELVRMANPASNPSMEAVDASVAGVEARAKDKDSLLTVFAEREDISQDLPDVSNPHDNPASLVYVSKDPDDVDGNTKEQPGLEEYDDEDEALDALTTPDDK